jgi:catechol 2,3-dioxygenase-like lactoylglutathione lyase family enzyme
MQQNLQSGLGPSARPARASHFHWTATTFLASAILLLQLLPALSAVRGVGAIGLTVANLDRELAFYTKVLAFEEVSRTEAQGPQVDALLGLADTHLKLAELKLGEEHLILTEHLTHKGRPIPADSRSNDRWFQHVAIVVRDMDQAYEQLRRHKVKHISTGPQTLPEWNKNAAGIRAFYFRDPEDHVLEIIWFPRGKGDPKWQQPTDRLFLGIDHTAIVVSDTDTSLAFYQQLLGLRIAGESENYGVEQEHLNQVFGARLRITSLRAEKGPGIEFLEYITPPGGRDIPADARASDLIFWRTDLGVDEIDKLAPKLKERSSRFVSKGAVTSSALPLESAHRLVVRDPDGHALQLIEEGSAIAGSRGP